MCGIAGFIDYKRNISTNKLKAITDTLSHRGPDDAGYFFDELTDYSIGLGHRRLAILDLSANGHQPMEHGGYRIVFNGEIYNYEEVREELKSLGHTFFSNSDTEVVLKGYSVWGNSIVDKLIGMFAIAIYDKNLHRLSLFRDRAGVKPLYYYYDEDKLIFASELKAILSSNIIKFTLDKRAVIQYMTLGYVPAPLSIIEGIKKLKPGSYLELDIANRHLSIKSYWDIIDFYNKPNLKLSYNEALLKLEELFISAFKYRLVSDVDYGIFFSGGYDSTAVTAILQANSSNKLKTFTIGFEDSEFDESKQAKFLSDYIGTEHYTFFCTEKDALEVVEKLPIIYDEPISDNSCIPTYLLSSITKKYVTVALSADGGDELLGGYDKYYNNYSYYERLLGLPRIIKMISSLLLELAAKLNVFKWIKNGNVRYENLKQLLSANKNTATASKIQAKLFTKSELDDLVKYNFEIPATGSSFDEFTKLNEDVSLLNKFFAIDYKTFMVDDILVKVDRASMAVGLESREPLLDHRIAEFIAQLPSKFKFRNSTRKALLKDIVHKYVPKDLVDRPKKGFVIPLDKWLRNDLSYLLDRFLSEEKINYSGIFNFKTITKIRKNFEEGSVADGDRLWRILILQMWYFKYMTNEA